MFLLGRGAALRAGRAASARATSSTSVLRVVTDPVIRAARWLTPRLVLDAHIPFVAVVLVAWIWLAIVFWALPAMCASGVRLHARCSSASDEEASRCSTCGRRRCSSSGSAPRRCAPSSRWCARTRRATRPGARSPTCCAERRVQRGDSRLRAGAGAQARRCRPGVQRRVRDAARRRPRARDGAHATRDHARSEARPRLVRPRAFARACRPLRGGGGEVQAKRRGCSRFNPYAGYQLGAVLAKLGRREELLAEYQRVKDFDPKISALMRREFGIDDRCR